MEQVLKVSSSIAEPLSLIAFVAALFFLLLKLLISKRNVQPGLVKKVVDRFWYLSLATLAIGGICYLAKVNHVSPDSAVPGVSNVVNAPNSGEVNQAGGSIVKGDFSHSSPATPAPHVTNVISAPNSGKVNQAGGDIKEEK